MPTPMQNGSRSEYALSASSIHIATKEHLQSTAKTFSGINLPHRHSKHSYTTASVHPRPLISAPGLVVVARIYRYPGSYSPPVTTRHRAEPSLYKKPVSSSFCAAPLSCDRLSPSRHVSSEMNQ